MSGNYYNLDIEKTLEKLDSRVSPSLGNTHYRACRSAPEYADSSGNADSGITCDNRNTRNRPSVSTTLDSSYPSHDTSWERVLFRS